jgi:transcriptional regulator with XRE-family HTH domain
MADLADPEDLKLLIRVLRGLRQWDQSTLAEAAGMDPSSVSHYETGRTVPPRKSVEVLAAAVGAPMAYVEGALLPVLAAGRVAATPFSAEELADPDQEAADLDQALVAAVRSMVAFFLEALEAARPKPWERTGRLSPEDRSLAAGLWERLEPRTADERLYLVESCREFQFWSLAERLCRESEEALPDRDRALELARLAHRVAELTPGEPAWRSRLEGYALGFLANAQRAAGDLAAAEATFARAGQLWEAGATGDPGWLGEGRLPTSKM